MFRKTLAYFYVNGALARQNPSRLQNADQMVLAFMANWNGAYHNG